MALTPEDVLNKNFTATQFRRGYDEQEVDDFLDEVVVELRRLIAENVDLRRQVESGGSERPIKTGPEIADGGASDPQQDFRVAKARADAERAEQDSRDRIAKARAQAERAEREARTQAERAERDARERIAAVRAEADATAAQLSKHPQSQQPAMPVAPPVESATDAAAVITLAQRLHDEYVNQGRSEQERMLNEANEQRSRLLGEAQTRHDELLRTGEERHKQLVSTAQQQHDRLIAEARGTHERMITEARERSTGMLAEAQQRRQSVLDELQHEEVSLTQRIEQLKTFERAYRTRLRGFIESQLQDLDAQPEVRVSMGKDSDPTERSKAHAASHVSFGRDSNNNHS